MTEVTHSDDPTERYHLTAQLPHVRHDLFAKWVSVFFLPISYPDTNFSTSAKCSTLFCNILRAVFFQSGIFMAKLKKCITIGGWKHNVVFAAYFQ